MAEVAVEEGTCTSASAQGRQGLLQLAPSASDQQILMRLLVLKENTWLHVASVYKSGFAGCTSPSRGQTFLLSDCEASRCFLAQDEPGSDLWVPWLPCTCHGNSLCLLQGKRLLQLFVGCSTDEVAPLSEACSQSQAQMRASQRAASTARRSKSRPHAAFKLSTALTA